MHGEEYRDPELEKLIDELVRKYYEEARERGSDSPVELVLDEKRFDEIICKYPVVVAVFTSPTCPACEMYRPILYMYAEKNREKLKGRVKFIEVDVYHLTEKAWELGVMSTPTTIIFHQCKPVEGFVGPADEETLDEVLKPYISS